MEEIRSVIYNLSWMAPGFLIAIVMHEYAHGFVAKRFGDDTAERAGRLSLNPAVHVDMMGSIVWPAVCLMLGGMIFGWAKPVPIAPRNFKEMKRGIFWVSFAGPLSNFILGLLSAVLMAVLVRVGTLPVASLYYFQTAGWAGKDPFALALLFSTMINFILGGFNMIPLPPLDGSRMVATFLKGQALRSYEEFARFTPMIFILVIALSMMGVPTIHYILAPFQWFATVLPVYILKILV